MSTHRNLTLFRVFVPVALLAAAATTPVAAQGAGASTSYTKATAGTVLLEARNGLQIRMLVDPSVLGGSEVEVGEMTLPAGSGQGNVPGHHHGSTEILYILSGRLDHIVNGESHLLEPGMVGIVRPGDAVVHRVVSSEPVKALVIWAPGGEYERLRKVLTEKPAPPLQRRKKEESDGAEGR